MRISDWSSDVCSSDLTTIASINRIEWQQEFQFLVDPAYGPAGLDNYLDWIAAWRAQACGAEAHPVIDPAILWLSRHKPSNPAVELLWGDSNAGNFLFAPDGSVIAAPDFEAAAIGQTGRATGRERVCQSG